MPETFDLIVRGGEVVNHAGRGTADVGVRAGKVVEIGSDSLDSAAPGGYDLLALMIGSEGLLGIVTEVTVKLTPKPQLAQVAMASFASVEAAGAAVGA